VSALDISAVVPVFEERGQLESVVWSLAAALTAAGSGGWELLLVVSLGARDGTPALAEALSRQDARVRVIRQSPDDPGYGRAVALGVQAATQPWLLIMDGDGQFVPAHLSRLAARARPGAAVVGIRSPRADSRARRLAGWCYSRVATALLGLGEVDDVDCGFKLMPRAAVEAAELRCRTGAVNLELLSACKAAGMQIVQVPIDHRPRSTGSSRYEIGSGAASGLPAWTAVRELAAEVWSLGRRRLRG
jgi:dolichol-phosphate mannosyltransferase